MITRSLGRDAPDVSGVGFGARCHLGWVDMLGYLDRCVAESELDAVEVMTEHHRVEEGGSPVP